MRGAGREHADSCSASGVPVPVSPLNCSAAERRLAAPHKIYDPLAPLRRFGAARTAPDPAGQGRARRKGGGLGASDLLPCVGDVTRSSMLEVPRCVAC